MGMRMIDFNVDIDKYLIDSGAYKYSEDVIAYTREIYEKMQDFEREKYLAFFNQHDIKITDFLNLFMSKSQLKYDEKGYEVLDSKELNKVFSDLLVYKEFLGFLLEDKMTIQAVGPKGDLIYLVSDEVRKYFKDKYGVDM